MFSHDDLSKAFRDQFMCPEIYGPEDYWECETPNGTEIIPFDVADDCNCVDEYCEGKIIDVTQKNGFLCRLSAPGYLDCTEWTAFKTEQECIDYLIETYADEYESGEG